MDALTPDDLLPLEEFAARRREFFAEHRRYLDRHRRVVVGPRVTLVFENRQTLWFRVQEVLRVARLNEPTRVRHELSLYNRLLPGRDCLQAALLIRLDETRLADELAPWRDLSGDRLALCLGTARYPADLLTARPEDRAVGAAHWVRFVLDAAAREALADARVPARLSLDMPHYRHESAPLGEDVRSSLFADLDAAEAA